MYPYFPKKRKRNIFAKGLDRSDQIEIPHKMSFSAQHVLTVKSAIAAILAAALTPICPTGPLARRRSGLVRSCARGAGPHDHCLSFMARSSSPGSIRRGVWVPARGRDDSL
jgi:hypothetical protein